jgi:hypothetical protein
MLLHKSGRRAQMNAHCRYERASGTSHRKGRTWSGASASARRPTPVPITSSVTIAPTITTGNGHRIRLGSILWGRIRAIDQYIGISTKQASHRTPQLQPRPSSSQPPVHTVVCAGAASPSP